MIDSAGNIVQASRLSGVPWRQHYRWLANEHYKQAYDFIREVVADMLEGAMLDHAINGFKKPLAFQGKLTGDHISEYQAQERIALLKGLKPQYRESTANDATGPIQIAIVYPNQQASKPTAIEPTLPALTSRGTSDESS